MTEDKLFGDSPKPGDTQTFGSSVALDGNRVAIGASVFVVAIPKQFNT